MLFSFVLEVTASINFYFITLSIISDGYYNGNACPKFPQLAEPLWTYLGTESKKLCPWTDLRFKEERKNRWGMICQIPHSPCTQGKATTTINIQTVLTIIVHVSVELSSPHPELTKILCVQLFSCIDNVHQACEESPDTVTSGRQLNWLKYSADGISSETWSSVLRWCKIFVPTSPSTCCSDHGAAAGQRHPAKERVWWSGREWGCM